jgi:hypothetical protein
MQRRTNLRARYYGRAAADTGWGWDWDGVKYPAGALADVAAVWGLVDRCRDAYGSDCGGGDFRDCGYAASGATGIAGSDCVYDTGELKFRTR